MTSIQPELWVETPREAVAFYEAAFGAVQVHRVGGTDEHEPVVAQLAVGDSSFWVADESPEHDAFSPETLGGGTVKLLLVVDEPQAVIDRAVGLGARQVYAAEAQHGWLLGRIEDPFGDHRTSTVVALFAGHWLLSEYWATFTH